MNMLPLPEITQLVTTELYINGQFQPGSGTTAISVTNPSTTKRSCGVAPASEAQVQNAIKAAATAFKSPAWQSLTGRDRGTLLYRLAELLRRDLEIFATLEAVDTGIPIRETRRGSPRGASIWNTSPALPQDRGPLPRSRATIQLRPTRTVWRDRHSFRGTRRSS